MKRMCLFLLIIIQLILIVTLGYKIFKKNRNILGVNVNTIKKSDIIFNKNSSLKFYYEPIPYKNIKEESQAKWIPPNITYIINSDGLNETKEYTINKPANTFRIITLGDSFTSGLFVNTKDNWPEKLESLLNNLRCSNVNKFEIINLGVAGYDIQYSIERYRLRGQKYNPDLIVWLLQNNDFDEINELMREKQDEIYKEMVKNDEINELMQKGYAYPLSLKLRQNMENIYRKLSEEKILNMQKSYLDEINKYYNKSLILTTFDFTNIKYKEILKNFEKNRKNTSIFDNLTNINEVKGATYLPNDYHPTIKGHTIITSDILNYLLKNKIIPCD